MTLAATVTIGVFGLLHPHALDIEPRGSSRLELRCGTAVHRILEGTARVRITSDCMASGPNGAAADFILSVPNLGGKESAIPDKIRRHYLGTLKTTRQPNGELTVAVTMPLETAVASTVAAETASNSGAAIWGAVSAVDASFTGAFLVVRLAGDRRRSVSIAHGAVSWGMSMLLAGMIALFASGVAAFSRTPANNNKVHRGSKGQTVSVVETTGDGGLVAIFATGGAVLALVGSMLGALAAASRESGVPFANEFRVQRRNGNRQDSVARDQTTILPPTH